MTSQTIRIIETTSAEKGDFIAYKVSGNEQQEAAGVFEGFNDDGEMTVWLDANSTISVPHENVIDMITPSF